MQTALESENSIGVLLRSGRQYLAALPSARLDCELLLSYTLQRPRSSLYAHPEYQLSRDELRQFTTLLERRFQGEPIAYLVGEREFWSLPLTVTPVTLIPRPETELLVELAIRCLRGKSGPRIADLGTGSGAIAIALAQELPEAHIIGTDTSEQALAVARLNAARHRPGHIEFRHGDWCTPLNGEYLDLIVANPPYVAETDPALTDSELRFEPHMALASGESGLAALTVIIRAAAGCLQPGGWLLLEHGAGQAAAVRSRLEAHGYQCISTHPDMAGLSRATFAQCNR